VAGAVTALSHPHRDALLAQHLQALFGEVSAEALQFLRAHLQWVEVAAGEVLMEQGDPGDSAWLSISGRLRVYVREGAAEPRFVRELGRGEVMGEMSLYTGEPRSATVVAVRDSVLVRLDKPHFEALLAGNPQMSIAFTRRMIRRLQTQHERRQVDAPVTIAVLPITDGVAPSAFARDLAAQLARHGRACVVDAGTMDEALDDAGIASRDDAAAEQRIALVLDNLEAQHDFVLLVAGADTGAWTKRCIRNGDELLLLADAAQPPALHPIEQACLIGRSARSEAAEILVLLHPPDLPCPRGTRRWLDRRPITGHVHVRPQLERDLARLARILARKAVGLVLAGGGARGFAHLGVWQALAERGIEIDCVGGTSIGAVMGTLIAADVPAERATGIARAAFAANPTGDYNVLPLMSLIKGRRVRAAIHGALADLVGGPIEIEDLWKGYFCIATNYSRAREQRVQRGDLAQALLASISIPGALPPVVQDGDLLCDGGTFNNFPVDAMREWRGIGQVIGSDLGAHNHRKLDFTEMPGSWALLADRLRPRHRRRYRLPSLASYLMNVTIIYSISRQNEVRRLVDVYFNPPLYKVGLLQWSRFDQIVRQGYQHAVEVLGRDAGLEGLPRVNAR
jgi:NTE family protein